MIEVVGRAAETAEEAVVAALERTISRAGAKARHHVSRMARAKGARPGPSDSPQAKSSGSGSTRTRRSLGSGVHISIEIRRMSHRSTARNMPLSVACRL